MTKRHNMLTRCIAFSFLTITALQANSPQLSRVNRSISLPEFIPRPSTPPTIDIPEASSGTRMCRLWILSYRTDIKKARQKNKLLSNTKAIHSPLTKSAIKKAARKASHHIDRAKSALEEMIKQSGKHLANCKPERRIAETALAIVMRQHNEIERINGSSNLKEGK